MTIRRAAFAVLFLILLPALAAGRAPAAERLPGPVQANLVRVVDGDTLEVRARVWLGQEIATRVRLDGIDAPELAGACARERDLARRAARLLRETLAAGGVEPLGLRDIRYGKFAGRVLARVETASGLDLGELLLARGLARRYDGGRRLGWCAQVGEATLP